MELTKKQFKKIEHLMPTQRKKSTISNYDFMRALLYIIENGCKWRALPKEYGNWHTIYVRFNRWSKNGTIDSIIECNIINIAKKVIYEKYIPDNVVIFGIKLEIINKIIGIIFVANKANNKWNIYPYN